MKVPANPGRINTVRAAITARMWPNVWRTSRLTHGLSDTAVTTRRHKNVATLMADMAQTVAGRGTPAAIAQLTV